MSDQAQSPPAPAPLADAARAEALKIADWCETERGSAETGAGAQIRVVWWLLIGGLVLLLVLPRLLQEIDFAWQKDSLPPEILKSFVETKEQIESNRVEMEQEKADADAQLLRLAAELEKAREEAAANETDILALLNQPYGVWRNVLEEEDDLPQDFTVNDIAIIGQNEIIVVGSVPGDPKSPDEGDTVATILHRSADGGWTVTTPHVGGKPGQEALAVIEGGDTRYLVSVWGEDISAILGSDDAVDWRHIWPIPRDRNVAIGDFLRMSDGNILAAGWDGSFVMDVPDSIVPVLMVSANGTDWSEITPSEANIVFNVSLRTLIETPRGIFAGGIKVTPKTLSRVILRSDNGTTWESEPVEGFRLSAGISAFAMNAENEVFAVTDDGDVLQYAGETDGWIHHERPFEDVTAIARLNSRELIRFSQSDDRRGSRIELRPFAATPETALALESDGRFLDGEIFTAVDLGDGRILAGGQGVLIESLSAGERALFIAGVFQFGRLKLGSVVAAPPGQLTTQRGHTAALVSNLSQVNAEVAGLEGNEITLTGLSQAVTQTLTRQEKVKADFGELSTQLEKALRTAEPARQLAQIGTRLAVIGLLIYLVQIVVNRYRYLQRLAGFYQARAQAFRLLAASPDAALLQGVTLADVTAMLSPDAIGFDKSAEPPTGQMVSLLQAGLKRG